MPLPNEDTITDEELDAELERIQQKITLTLQSIDENFERCNQIVTGRIIPEIDKFTQSSRDLWERSKLWLYFFKLQGYGTADENIEQTQHTTNRPPVNYDPAHFPPSMISATWKRLYEDLNKNRAAAATTTGNNNSTAAHTSMATGLFSPTRTTTDSVKGMLRPGGTHNRMLSPAELTHTGQANHNHLSVARNIQQQLQDMNQRQASVSDSETSTGPGLFGIKLRRHLGANSPASSISSSISNELEAEAEATAKRGQHYISTPVIRRNENGTISYIYSATNPVNRSSSTTSKDLPPSATPPPIPLPHTPSARSQMMTMTPKGKQPSLEEEREQIVASYYGHLKQSRSKRPKLNWSSDNIPSQTKDTINPQEELSTKRRNLDDINKEEEDIGMSDLDEESAPWAGTSVASALAAASPLRPLHNDDDQDLAIEFSPMVVRQHDQADDSGTPQSQRDTSSISATNSMISMISGNDGRIPARFSLSYFPETFWHPPGSTKLTRMYSLFSDRPGQRLTLEQVVDYMNVEGGGHLDMAYLRDSSKPLLDLLVHKRFLRRMDKGWVLRN